jgi:hypothetical protein
MQHQAFKPTHFSALQLAVKAMARKHLQFEPCTFNHEDAFNLFIEGENHSAVRAAADLYGAGNLPYYISLPLKPLEALKKPVTYTVSMHGRRTFGFPLNSKIAASAPDYLVTQLMELCKRRAEISLQYGLVMKTLNELNEICTTPGQVSFLWPTVSVIASQVDDLKNLPLNVKSKSLPSVSPGLRAACRETAATIALFQMLGDAPTQSRTDVQVELNNNWDCSADGPLGPYTGI